MLIPPDEHFLLLAERWLKLLSNLGRAQATLTAYRSALYHYFAFCSQRRIEPLKARFEDLAAYISPQLPGMPFPAASATLQLRLSAIRLWYDFLMYLDLCTVNPLPRSGTPGMPSAGRGLVPRLVKLPHIPDDAQWQSFLFYAAASPLRDRLMLALTYYGALQQSEVTSLSIEDFDFAHRLIRIRAETTKSRRERIVCYSPAVMPVLAAHLMQMKRTGITRGALFRSRSDRNQDAPLTIWTWSKTVRKWALESGLPDISTPYFPTPAAYTPGPRRLEAARACHLCGTPRPSHDTDLYSSFWQGSCCQNGRSDRNGRPQDGEPYFLRGEIA